MLRWQKYHHRKFLKISDLKFRYLTKFFYFWPYLSKILIFYGRIWVFIENFNFDRQFWSLTDGFSFFTEKFGFVTENFDFFTEDLDFWLKFSIFDGRLIFYRKYKFFGKNINFQSKIENFSQKSNQKFLLFIYLYTVITPL